MLPAVASLSDMDGICPALAVPKGPYVKTTVVKLRTVRVEEEHMKIEPDLPVLWRERVLNEWCDYNNHLNVAYYVLIFDHATDAFYDSVGLDEAYRTQTNCSTFAVEAHVNYLAEVHADDEVFCTTQLLDCDEKRFHYFHRMYHAEQGFLSATTELMGVHVNMERRRVAPMGSGLHASFAQLLEEHKRFPKPEQSGRVIGIRRK